MEVGLSRFRDVLPCLPGVPTGLQPQVWGRGVLFQPRVATREEGPWTDHGEAHDVPGQTDAARPTTVRDAEEPKVEGDVDSAVRWVDAQSVDVPRAGGLHARR